MSRTLFLLRGPISESVTAAAMSTASSSASAISEACRSDGSRRSLAYGRRTLGRGVLVTEPLRWRLSASSAQPGLPQASCWSVDTVTESSLSELTQCRILAMLSCSAGRSRTVLASASASLSSGAPS